MVRAIAHRHFSGLAFPRLHAVRRFIRSNKQKKHNSMRRRGARMSVSAVYIRMLIQNLGLWNLISPVALEMIQWEAERHVEKFLYKAGAVMRFNKLKTLQPGHMELIGLLESIDSNCAQEDLSSC